MAKVEWGFLYNAYHNNNTLSSTILEREVKYLRADVGNGDNDHLKNTAGIYEYVLARANGVDEKEAVKLLILASSTTVLGNSYGKLYSFTKLKSMKKCKKIS